MNPLIARAARLSLSLLSLLSLAALNGCDGSDSPDGDPFAKPSGYWEGKGTLVYTDMKDQFRHMERKADYEFWFTMDGDGDVSGEVEVLYDATLTVTGLPEVNGPVTFAPEVGGKVTDPNPRRRYTLGGRYDAGVLLLEAQIPEDAPTVMFTFRASANIGANGGGIGAGGMRTKDIAKEMPMTPFDPFIADGTVVKRPQGPHAARYEAIEEKRSVKWTATQVTSREERP